MTEVIKIPDKRWNYSAFDWGEYTATETTQREMLVLESDKTAGRGTFTEQEIEENHLYIKIEKEQEYNSGTAVEFYTKNIDGTTVVTQGTKAGITYLYPEPTTILKNGWNFNVIKWDEYANVSANITRINYYGEFADVVLDTAMQEGELYILTADEEKWSTGSSAYLYTKSSSKNYISFLPIEKYALEYIGEIANGKWNYERFRWRPQKDIEGNICKITPKKEVDTQATTAISMQEKEIYIKEEEITVFLEGWMVDGYIKYNGVNYRTDISQNPLKYLLPIDIQLIDGTWNYSAFNWGEYKTTGKQLIKITPDKTLDADVVLDTAMQEGELYIENLELNKNNFTQGNKVKIYATQNGVTAEATAGKAEIEYLLPISVTVADGNWNYSAFNWYKLKEPGTQYKKIQPDKTLETSVSSSIEFDNLYITNTQEEIDKYNSGRATRAYAYNNIVMAYAEIEKERLQYLKQPPEPEKVVFIDKDWNLGQFTWYKAEPQDKEFLKINKDKTVDATPVGSLENENIYIEKTELAKFNANEVVKVYAKQSGIVGYASISKTQLKYLKQEPPIPPKPEYNSNYWLEEKGIFTEVLYSAQGLRAFKVKMDNFSSENTNTNEGGIIVYDGEKWESINTHKPTTQKPIQVGIVLKKIDDIGVIVAVSGDFKKEVIGYANKVQNIDADWHIGYNLIMQKLKSYAIIKCNVNIF